MIHRLYVIHIYINFFKANLEHVTVKIILSMLPNLEYFCTLAPCSQLLQLKAIQVVLKYSQHLASSSEKCKACICF